MVWRMTAFWPPVLLVSPFSGVLLGSGIRCVSRWSVQLRSVWGELSVGQQEGTGCVGLKLRRGAGTEIDLGVSSCIWVLKLHFG